MIFRVMLHAHLRTCRRKCLALIEYPDGVGLSISLNGKSVAYIHFLQTPFKSSVGEYLLFVGKETFSSK